MLKNSDMPEILHGWSTTMGRARVKAAQRADTCLSQLPSLYSSTTKTQGRTKAAARRAVINRKVGESSPPIKAVQANAKSYEKKDKGKDKSFF